ncbi:MAG: tetratricopeptide repeat protein, partial [Desulfobacterales bacterium]
MAAKKFNHRIATLCPSTPGGLKLAEEYNVVVIEKPSRNQLESEIERADITQVSWWNNPEITDFLHSYIPDTRLVIRYHVAGHTPPQCIVKEHLDMADINVISYNELPLLQSYDEAWRNERFEWILHGTDLTRLGDTHHKPHQTFNVGYIGTVSFIKMHPAYVRMSNEINVPNIKFVVCGNIEEASLLQQVNNFNAQHKFEFKGYVNNIGEIISEMDVFGYPLCPDTYASTDLVLQEVMYAGVPAVVFNYGGLAQTVKDGQNGIIVNSEKEYKEAIEYLYNNPAERERLGKNAKSYVEKNLGIQNTIKQYHSVYERLLAKDKSWHEWGKDACKPLLEQSISYQNITGEPPERKTADIFIASLGPYGSCFAKSMDLNLSNRVLFKADDEIANVSDMIYRIGLLWYRGYDPKDAYLNFWIGLVLKSRQNTMQAMEFWARAHENGFDHWRLYWYMAESLRQCGQETDALKVYQYLARIKPEWEEIIRRVDPSKDVSAIATIDKPPAETIYGDIISSLKSDESKEPNHILEDFLKSYPDYALAHNDLGVLLYNQGEKEKAHYHYQQAAQLDPENMTFQKNLADFYYVELGQVEKALQIYVKVLNADPKDIETLLILGHISISLEKFEDAKSFYSSVLNIEPENADARESLEKLEKYQLSLVAGQSDRTNIELGSKGYLVSAIVSTYNAERFMRGRLEDLENQTIADRLEIIVVNSGSQQNEEKIIKEFQEKYSNIKYIKTNQRETVYAAWNRGIKASQGKYITNANTDDRLRNDALEVMVNTLETLPEISLVYADVIITETENETFKRCTPVGNFKWLNFNRDDLLNKGCFVGPQPMWRREIHDEYGFFDASFVTSGDYEFWLRVSQTCTFMHLPVQLGLYLRSPGSIEHSNRERQREENNKILDMYRKAQSSGKIIRRIQDSTSPGDTESKSEDMKSPETIYQNIQTEMGNKPPEEVIRELEKLAASHPEFALAHNDLGVLHYHTGNKEKAQQYYEKAVQLDSENMVFQKNLADFYFVELSRIEDALKIYVRILTANPQDVETLMATGQICRALEKFDDARDFFNQVLQIEPWNADARKQIEEMEKPLSEANFESESAEDAYRKIQETLNTLPPEKAVVELEKLVESYPDFAAGHNQLAVLYYNTGDKEKSLQHYQQAAHLQPENITLQKNLADFLFVELGKMEDALQIYIDILATHPDDVDTLLICGHICVALKKFDDAQEYYERILALEPG